MPTPDALLDSEYEARAFVRLCRREQPLRDLARLKREAEEATRAAQRVRTPIFDPFNPEMPAFLRRQAD